MTSNPLKKCTKCGCTGIFFKDKRLKSGLKSICKICYSEAHRAWREANAKSNPFPSPNKNKICTKCEGTGPFYRDRAHKNGFTSWCKVCIDLRVKERLSIRINKESKSRRQQTKRYGLFPVTLDHMIEFQAGLCGICTSPMKPGKETHIDHDHNTGLIRGLLCHRCNLGLGMFRENSTILLCAISYLETFSK